MPKSTTDRPPSFFEKFYRNDGLDGDVNVCIDINDKTVAVDKTQYIDLYLDDDR